MLQRLQTAEVLIGIAHGVSGGGEDADWEVKDRCQMDTRRRKASNGGLNEM